MRCPALGPVLCLATVGSLASQQPWTEIEVDPAVLEAVALVYRMASVEIVFCIEGNYDTVSDIYHVERLVMAPQTDNCADGAHFDCTGYGGWVHNHRGRGDKYCRMSETDLATLRGNPDLVLALGWCRDGGWFHDFDIRPAEQVGPDAEGRVPAVTQDGVLRASTVAGRTRLDRSAGSAFVHARVTRHSRCANAACPVWQSMPPASSAWRQRSRFRE